MFRAERVIIGSPCGQGQLFTIWKVQCDWLSLGKECYSRLSRCLWGGTKHELPQKRLRGRLTDPLFTCKTGYIYNLADRRSAINRQEGGKAASKVVLRLSPFPFRLLPTFLPFPQTESLFTGYMLHIPNSTKRKKKKHNVQYV